MVSLVLPGVFAPALIPDAAIAEFTHLAAFLIQVITIGTFLLQATYLAGQTVLNRHEANYFRSLFFSIGATAAYMCLEVWVMGQILNG